MRSVDQGIPTGKPPGSTPADVFIDDLADRVAERVLAGIRAEPGLGTPRYATAKENPTGSRKAFLRGCRDKAFPSFKLGRRRAAEWADVERWWKAQPTARPDDDLRSELDAASGPVRRGRRTP